ncbi:MAG: elongation factor Ts [Chloroflexi bacterium]|nr:elongation factor Ts [Chloroflexota bacterium]MBI2979947.1 elongation factor Ts [Chloroflexota bacterium]
MKISVDRVKELREQSGAGIMECRNILTEAEGDMEKALQILKQRTIFKVEKKSDRVVSQGLIEAYIHAGGRIGALVEVNCETDFAARTDELKQLAHNLAMQVAAMPPQFIAREEVPDGTEIDTQTTCLLLQPYIKDLSLTVQDIINQAIAKVGENIKVKRFARFELGQP